MVEIVNIVNFRKKLNVKAVVIGHFAFGLNYSDGQTVKTRNIYEALKKNYGDNNIKTIDTHGTLKALILSPFVLLMSFIITNNVVILPAHRSLCVYAPIISFYKKLFPNVRIHYAVVGGWLPSLLQNKTIIKQALNSFDYIYVETNTMRESLIGLGYNCIVMPNFKNLTINKNPQKSDFKVKTYNETYNICTFSRVMKEKGIEDAIKVVTAINEKEKKVCFKLDIYGPIDPTQVEWFNKIMKIQLPYIEYKGVVSQNEIIKTLSNYFVLLFPTRFYTEGIPGTIIDAYASGIPVIASKWESFSDIIVEGETGYGYEFNDLNELESILYRIYNHPDLIFKMKLNCISCVSKYDAANAIKIMKERLE